MAALPPFARFATPSSEHSASDSFADRGPVAPTGPVEPFAVSALSFPELTLQFLFCAVANK